MFTNYAQLGTDIDIQNYILSLKTQNNTTVEHVNRNVNYSTENLPFLANAANQNFFALIIFQIIGVIVIFVLMYYVSLLIFPQNVTFESLQRMGVYYT